MDLFPESEGHEEQGDKSPLRGDAFELAWCASPVRSSSLTSTHPVAR